MIAYHVSLDLSYFTPLKSITQDRVYLVSKDVMIAMDQQLQIAQCGLHKNNLILLI